MTTSSKQPALGIEVRKHTLREAVGLLTPVLRLHRWRLITGAALIAVAGGAQGIMPLFSKYLIDVAIKEKSVKLALMIGGGYFVAQTIRQCFWYGAMHHILFLQERVTFSLRSQGFGHIQRLCLRFHSMHPTGFLYQRVFGSAIASVGGCMQSVIKNLSLYVTGVFVSLIGCLILSPAMTGVVVLGSTGYVLISRVISRNIYSKSRESQDAQNLITQFIMDRLRGTKTVQALAMEDFVQEDFESRLWPAQMKNLAVAKESFRLALASESLSYLLTSTVMVMGAYCIFNFDLTVGDLVAFTAYQATFITLVSVLANMSSEIASARAGVDQLLTVFETQSTVPSVVDDPQAPAWRPTRGDLSLQSVHFSYDGKTPVVNDLSVHVPFGQSVALVGRSGSGKTTLANLLLRFYDPDRGRIMVDDTDVRQVPLRQWRSQFGVVLQDPYLFDETIETNLRYAAPHATRDELIEALEQARAWSFIQKLPGQLEYRVGESGGQLSGGQKQRLAIARCLLLKSRFVILDEPTSALDVESEQAIQLAFDQLFKNRTVFIIAHRLSTIRRADRILVLDNGGLVQDGTYADLVQQEGLFRLFHQIAMDPTDPQSARLHQPRSG